MVGFGAYIRGTSWGRCVGDDEAVMWMRRLGRGLVADIRSVGEGCRDAGGDRWCIEAEIGVERLGRCMGHGKRAWCIGAVLGAGGDMGARLGDVDQGPGYFMMSV